MLTGCSSTQKIDTLKPEPDDASPLGYDSSPSFINLPISIKLSDIENQTNALLTGLIYEDNNIEDDDIEMKVWKQAPIKIENDNGSTGEKIKTVLPLKVWVKYRIGTKKLGVELYNYKEFNLNGVQGTMGPVAPLMIVNGPYAKHIGLHGGNGCFGPGFRANRR